MRAAIPCYSLPSILLTLSLFAQQDSHGHRQEVWTPSNINWLQLIINSDVQLSTTHCRSRPSWYSRGRFIPWCRLLVRPLSRPTPISLVFSVSITIPECSYVNTCQSSSLSIWYPRHHLQFRIGLFFGAASLSGKSPCLTIIHVFQPALSLFTKLIPHRCIFRSACLCYKLHGWQEWSPRMVLDLRTFLPIKDWDFITSILIPWSDHRRNYDSRGWLASTILYVSKAFYLYHSTTECLVCTPSLGRFPEYSKISNPRRAGMGNLEEEYASLSSIPFLRLMVTNLKTNLMLLSLQSMTTHLLVKKRGLWHNMFGLHSKIGRSAHHWKLSHAWMVWLTLRFRSGSTSWFSCRLLPLVSTSSLLSIYKQHSHWQWVSVWD